MFGVALETLLRKDMILWEETWSSVPSVMRALSGALRARTQDEGLLRVPGNKQKVGNSRQTETDILYEFGMHEIALT